MTVPLYQNPDGACAAARAVLAYLSEHELDLRKTNPAYGGPTVARWHNCREQGYVVSLYDLRAARQLNIAFFEHRNSDEICAVEWEQQTINPPTIDTAEFLGGLYRTKYDVSHSVRCNEAIEMANWIQERLQAFVNLCSAQP